MPVYIHTVYTDFQTPSQQNLSQFVEALIKRENKEPGSVNIIFTDNEEVFALNSRYLNHHYYTDVLAFPYSENGPVEGDIFISLDKVYENSLDYDTEFENELLRVLIHGVLHLIGYDDLTSPEQQHMHHLENRYLEWYYLYYRSII